MLTSICKVLGRPRSRAAVGLNPQQTARPPMMHRLCTMLLCTNRKTQCSYVSLCNAQNAGIYDPSYAENTLCLKSALIIAHRTLLSTPRGHATLKLDAGDVCWVACVALVFASGVAEFVAWGCAAAEVKGDAAALVL